MFKRLRDPGQDRIAMRFEDREIECRRGDMVAAALLAAGVVVQRTSVVSGEDRGPYCLIGNCFECLVEIDGVPNRQACLTPVREGMRVKRQRGARGAAA
jgi:predicted molibdopterin-dependent oxidoreductase YjgC